MSTAMLIRPHAQQVLESEQVNVENLTSLSLTELAGRANEAAAMVDEHGAALIGYAVQCGMALIAAKDKTPHGQWMTWLEENFEKDVRTARRYMAVANGTRASVLTGTASIREALRLIAGPKEGTKEAKQEEKESVSEAADTRAVEMLMTGKSMTEVMKATRLSQLRVSELYHSVVVPELCRIDWKHEVLKQKVKEVAVIKHIHVIQAHCVASKRKGGAMKYAAEEIGTNTVLLVRCNRVMRLGCPQLIQRMTDGEITINAALKIAVVPIGEQEVLLRSLERQDAVDAVDDLRSRVSTMRDQEFGWTRKYGDGKKAFRDLCREADRIEVEEIVGQMRLVSKWVLTVIFCLEGELCSQSTDELSNS